MLLCGGAVTAGVLVVQNVTDRAKEAVEPILEPSLPTVPTELPDLPQIPDLPTDLPDLPTNLPELDSGKKITVVYEVTGDGPAEIVYTEKLGESPKRVTNAKLPWKLTTSMQVATLVSVTAIRSSTDSGTISCRATVDGEEVAQRTREGTFATASCTKMILN
ncbi:MAG TPA: MmpS family transport accessory protein [Actinoplanes sp.]|nr:MmpS family transport accessory protein [Actinoplanes sp.]